MSLSEMVSVRFSAGEVKVIREAAQEHGWSVSEYIRQAAYRYVQRLRAVGTARCEHFSVGNVTAASCGMCGPLPVVYAA